MVTLRVSILHVVKHGDVIASEAKQPLDGLVRPLEGCFVASLLAMTGVAYS